MESKGTMTKISALSPSGFTIELTCPDSEADVFGWLLEIDEWLKENHFTPLPVPKSGSGGGNWNKGGTTAPRPRNWVDVDPNKPILYVNLAWHGENKEQNDAYKIEWANKLEAATGVRYTLDTSQVDDKGKKLYLWVYPLKVGTKLLEVLPEAEFERRPTLQARLAKAQKNK
jgi:hypothetical protein